MKKFLKIFLILTVFFLPMTIQADTPSEITIHYFMDERCPNCREVTTAFNDYLASGDKDHINIVYYDVVSNKHGEEELFLEVANIFSRKAPLIVPYIVIGGTDLQGSVEIVSFFEEVIEFYEEKIDYVDVVDKTAKGQTVTKDDIIPNPAKKTITLPFIGTIELETFSLFIGAVIIGLIDGFNPCAMWILIFLITMLINLKDRKRIWILGTIFILTSGILYYIIMLSWLQVVIRVAMIQAFQIAIGILALVFSFFSIKHYWQQRKKDTGCEVTSAKSQSKLMERVKKVISKNNLWLAIIGIIGIAITVNIIELACSAGLPVIYSSMLAFHDVSPGQSALYILVYVFFFLIDDILVFTIAVITLRVTGISSKYAKYSNLIGGLIMLFIGILLIFFPQLLF